MAILWRILAAQAGATLLAAAFAALASPQAAVSAFLGGVACLVPGLYALLFLQSKRDVIPDSGMSWALRSEASRLALTAAVLGCIFAGYQELHLPAFFCVFAGLQWFYGLIPYLAARRQQAKKPPRQPPSAPKQSKPDQ